MYSRSGRTINKAFNCFKDENKSEVDVLNLHDAQLRKDLRRQTSLEQQIVQRGQVRKLMRDYS